MTPIKSCVFWNPMKPVLGRDKIELFRVKCLDIKPAMQCTDEIQVQKEPLIQGPPIPSFKLSATLHNMHRAGYLCEGTP